MPDHLEFPRPLRLLWTITWNLIESAGLPIGAPARISVPLPGAPPAL